LVSQLREDKVDEPLPQIDLNSVEDVSKALAKAISRTRDAIVTLAIRKSVLEQTRADRTAADEMIMDAARGYREAEGYLERSIHQEVNLHMAALALGRKED
jgi:hypothetical protein